MNTKDIKDILKLVSELDLKEVRIKDGEFEIRVRTDKDTPAPVLSSAAMPMVASAPALSVAPGSSTPAVSEVTQAEAPSASDGDAGGNYIEIKSPMVGTFYRSAAPDKPPFVQVGDTIASGDVVCIIEAMKLFNEIESEVSGKIVKVMIDDSSPVEYDQVLFLVEPN